MENHIRGISIDTMVAILRGWPNAFLERQKMTRESVTFDAAIACFKQLFSIYEGKTFSKSSEHSVHYGPGGIDITGQKWVSKNREEERVAEIWKKSRPEAAQKIMNSQLWEGKQA